MKIVLPGQCMHSQWCSAKPGEAHSAECPTQLKLSDGDVDGFCAKHVGWRWTGTSGSVLSLHGEYDGRTALAGPIMTNADEESARRWLAENLIKHAKQGRRNRGAPLS